MIEVIKAPSQNLVLPLPKVDSELQGGEAYELTARILKNGKAINGELIKVSLCPDAFGIGEFYVMSSKPCYEYGNTFFAKKKKELWSIFSLLQRREFIDEDTGKRREEIRTISWATGDSLYVCAKRFVAYICDEHQLDVQTDWVTNSDF